MRQLLPHEGHLCGITKKGFYPEVVQHTNWDYGKMEKDIITIFLLQAGWSLRCGNFFHLDELKTS